jgi:hypothetical protein
MATDNHKGCTICAANREAGVITIHYYSAEDLAEKDALIRTSLEQATERAGRNLTRARAGHQLRTTISVADLSILLQVAQAASNLLEK